MKSIVLLYFIILGVILNGCGASITPALYLPQQTDEIKLVYRNGNPFAYGQNDTVSFVVSIEPDMVAGQQYMRVWILLKNNSQSEILLQPEKIAKILVREKNDIGLLRAVSPNIILKSIDDKKASEQIWQSIGGLLSSVTVQPTAVKGSNGTTYTIDDTHEKRKEIAKETNAVNNATEIIYDMYKTSVNSGIFKIHTLFPGESINGYIYFGMSRNFNSLFRHPEKLFYTVSIQIGKVKSISFAPKLIF